ncbi:sodium/glutamate symporter [Stappia sp. GBMRC 2046]|uniref:Sodium/glutamate symporter n=1 Tax=Stappia sediminis TaxID=2692190 RepID=A0A7X3LVV0_9HYPH|nr:sodium/glutamate symporter [Stappia sediminis]MXN66064.1 sodium/glutamate symporter [Stappia sediminis]
MTIGEFASFNIGILVYFAGVRLNGKITFLNRYNIPEPVSGGLFVAGIVLLVYLVSGSEIGFSLETRDFLLLYFFTSIGLNARFADLLKGGRPLALLLGLTIAFMILQNIVGVVAGVSMGLPVAFGLIGGTVSLVGGHGTAIAWAPTFAETYGVASAAEIGAATATLGLILASIMGGPTAKYLIEGRGAKPAPEVHEKVANIGFERDGDQVQQITHVDLMRSLLVLNIAIVLGVALQKAIGEAGLELPLFVVCLFCGILLSNIVPMLFPRLAWPARTPGLAVISEFALGVFLAISLMSLQLWTIAGLAGPMLIILGLQVLAAGSFILFVLFPVMGRDYEAAVLGAGFAGFALGATPTAIANMTAVTKHYGPATKAFLILPLVSAFFVDLANAAIIRVFLNLS